MKTIIEQIDDNAKFYNIEACPFKRADYLQSCKVLIDGYSSLVEGRQLLPEGFLDNMTGIPCDRIGVCGVTWNRPNGEIGMSYDQIIAYLIRYARKRKHMKRPYTIKTK